jgi:hypothetical protein
LSFADNAVRVISRCTIAYVANSLTYHILLAEPAGTALVVLIAVLFEFPLISSSCAKIAGRVSLRTMSAFAPAGILAVCVTKTVFTTVTVAGGDTVTDGATASELTNVTTTVSKTVVVER